MSIPTYDELAQLVLDCERALADMSAARRKGYLAQTGRDVFAMADRIRAAKNAEVANG